MKEDVVTRLREFVETEMRSCSIDIFWFTINLNHNEHGWHGLQVDEQRDLNEHGLHKSDGYLIAKTSENAKYAEICR